MIEQSTTNSRRRNVILAVVTFVLVFALGTALAAVLQRANGTETVQKVGPDSCTLENPDRPCDWNKPDMVTHINRHDAGWPRLRGDFRFTSHFFDVLEAEWRSKVKSGELDPAPYRQAARVGIDCDNPFGCWWEGIRSGIECLAPRYQPALGCSAGTGTQTMWDTFFDKITWATIGCVAGGGAGIIVGAAFAQPVVIGAAAAAGAGCVVDEWIKAEFGH